MVVICVFYKKFGKKEKKPYHLRERILLFIYSLKQYTIHQTRLDLLYIIALAQNVADTKLQFRSTFCQSCGKFIFVFVKMSYGDAFLIGKGKGTLNIDQVIHQVRHLNSFCKSQPNKM